MFRDIPQAVQVTQGHLKALEAWRSAQGDPARRMRQLSPEAGKLLALLLCGCPAGDALEIGAGGGYASLWLALACRATGRRLTAYERAEPRAELARQSLGAAGVGDVVELVQGDGLEGLTALPAAPALAFCLIDCDPGQAAQAFELALDRLVPGGLACVTLPAGVPANIVVEKKHSGGHIDIAGLPPEIIAFRRFLFDAEMDPRVDAVSLPLEDTPLLVCRKV